jgi:large subunit ribosomal protein L7/L12
MVGGLRKMAKITKEDVIGFIENMSVLELSDLVKELEEKFGVSAAAMSMAMAAPAAAAGEAPAAAKEEKTEFDVILQAIGEKKIQVIKVVRALTGLGLKEAKDLVDGAPNPVQEGISQKEAGEAKQKLEEVGATIELK